MAQIIKPDNQPLHVEDAQINLPPDEIPSFRLCQALERKVDHKMLIECWGGLGDLMVAEPAIRYAATQFKGIEVSVETWFPELFRHIPLKAIYERDKDHAIKANHYVFKSLQPTESLSWEFVKYANCQRVDYCSLVMFGRQLPVADRALRFMPSLEELMTARAVMRDGVILHPGRTWKSRTMPKDWWDALIRSLVHRGISPVIVGATWTDGNRGTVDVDTTGCLDIRGKLSLMETIALLQEAKVVLTNDSAPLHMAASGRAWIGFLSTANHPDYITHWREDGPDVKWGWRMQDFALGGMWQKVPMLPNDPKRYTLHDVEEAELRSWLPNPGDMAHWAMEKI